MHNRTIFLSTIVSLCLCSSAAAQINSPVDEATTVTLVGNVHPLVYSATSSKAADLGMSMQHMVLSLNGSPAQEAALAQLVAEQNDPKSPSYHQYLTPQTYASLFGASQSDMKTVTSWLQSHGFTVEQAPAGNRTLIFSGTAAQVNTAFKTQIRQYTLAGASYYANATDPSIPAALAGAVGGVVKLHNIQHSPNITTKSAVAAAQLSSPQYTSGSTHRLTPADYAVIYDINPLYTAGINGTGQTIAILARSDISMSDVENFRSTFGLKANNPQFIITNSDPGVVSGDTVETTLDTEWSGAVAPNATVKVIISASSNSADGIDLSAIYAVNNNVAPVISLSYGSCELGMGASELNFYNSLWKQAAAQGQTVLVSAGDSGAAGCDYGSTAYYGKNVNGLCTSPYDTCVGGTEFADTTNPGQYWLTSNSATYGSAIGYIPETVWNESGTVSGGSGLWAGGGGASTYYSKPSWQTGAGVPADGKRDVPDVAMTAASHDGYYIAYDGGYYVVGGTSAAAPSFAGIMALVDQKMNARQGVVNPILYPLAITQAGGGAAVFHDTTAGNNSVPGQAGFSATKGYDQASGLGSVDANLLVNHWSATSTAPSLTVTASASSLTVIVGQSGQTTITSAATALNSAVALTVTGAPTGMTATLSAASIASPGSGSVTLNVVNSASIVPGTYTLTVSGSGAGQTGKATISVLVPTPTFAVATSALSLTAMAGNSVSIPVSTTPQNGFSATIALSVTGVPSGVAAVFSPTSITGSAPGISTLKLTLPSSTTAGTYALTIKGTSASLSTTTTVSVIINAPTFTLTSSVASLSVTQGGKSQLTLTTAVQNGFSAAQALSVSGLPTGVTAAFSPVSIGASGGQSTLTITATTNAVMNSYPVTIAAVGGGLSRTIAITLAVGPTASCTIGSNPASATLNSGSSTSFAVSCGSPKGTFNGPLALAVSAPSGITASFAASTLVPGNTTTLNIAAANSATAGSYNVGFTVSGSGYTQTLNIPVTVVVPAPFAITASQYILNMKPGTITQLTATTSSYGSFSSQVSLATTLTGNPAGISATLSQSAIAAPGNGTVSVSVNVASTVAAGTYPLQVTATAAGVPAATAYLSVVVFSGPSFSFGVSTTALTIKQGSSGAVTTSTGNYNGGFNGQLSMSFSGIPYGMNYGVASANAANNTVNITYSLTAATTVAPGTYPITITASGSGINHSATIQVTVTK